MSTITHVYKQTRRNRRSRKAKTITSHQRELKGKEQDLIQRESKSEAEILRDFDLTLDYGPCVGISRMERWERAQKHGLNPPTQVKEIIKQHIQHVTFTQSLWVGYNI